MLQGQSIISDTLLPCLASRYPDPFVPESLRLHGPSVPRLMGAVHNFHFAILLSIDIVPNQFHNFLIEILSSFLSFEHFRWISNNFRWISNNFRWISNILDEFRTILDEFRTIFNVPSFPSTFFFLCSTLHLSSEKDVYLFSYELFNTTLLLSRFNSC